MLRLGTFGGLSLRRDGGDGAIASVQRRRLAILVLLATAGERGMSRDKLIAYLWPESDDVKAANSLKQAIFTLRRDLGGDVFLQTTPTIALNPAVFAADCQEFECALGEGRLEDAVALYGGHFLDGFHISGAPEFERWSDMERDRLSQLARTALESLAARAAADRDAARAAGWWKQLSLLDPLDTRVALSLMSCLAAAGDRAGALRHARAYQTLIRQELDAEPDPAIAQLESRLREAPPADQESLPFHRTSAEGGEQGVGDAPAERDHDAAREQEPGDSATGAIRPELPTEPMVLLAAPEPPVADTTDANLPHDESPAPVAAPRIPGKQLHGIRWRAALPAAAALIGAVAWAAHRYRANPVGTPAGAGVVAIAPFEVTASDSSLRYLREGMVALLSAKLGDGRWLRAGTGEVAPGEALRAARRIGAAQLVTGTVIGGSGRITISASLNDVPGGRERGSAVVTGTVDSLAILVDQLAAQLLARHAGALGPRLAAFSSTSAPTLRAYLEGQAAYRRGQYDDAAAHFTRAIAYDSTFAPAGLGLAQVGSWTGRAHDWKRGIELAAATVTRLGERDQIFLNALAGNGGHEGTLLTANLNAWESAVETSPERPEVWHGFGNMLLAAGRAISPTAHQRARSAFQRAIELDPAFAPGLFQATRLAALASDTAAVRKLGTRYLELDSTSGASQYIRWRMALMLSDEATLRALRARFESFDKPTLRRIALTSQTDAVAPEDGERAIRAWLAWAVRSEDRFEALAFAHAFALNRGLAHDAADYTRALAELEPSPNFHLRLRITDALYAAGDSGAAARAAAELARVADASRTGRALGEGAAYDDLCALEQWRVAHGAYGTAPRAIGLLRESAAGVLPRWDHRTCALLLHAAVGVGTGAPDAAARVARLDSLLRLGPPLDELAPYANLAAARLHEALGDRERALEAVRRRRYAVGVPRYLSAQWLEEGRLADLADDREGAARAYERYRALASIPSPALALRRGAPRQATRAWAPAPAPR